MLLIGILSFMTVGLIAYIAASPFIFQEHYHLSSLAFSLYFALNAAGFTIGAHIAGKIPQKTGIKIGVIGGVLVGLLLYVLVLTDGSFWLIEFCLFAYGFTYGILAPEASSLVRQYAGSASAMAGFFPILMGGIISPLIGIGDSFVTFGFIILVSTILALFSWWIIHKQI